MINEQLQSLALPKGLATVDLINERGKVVQREQAENFVSGLTNDMLKQIQRSAFGMYATGSRPVDVWGRSVWDVPPLPLNHLAAWNDSAAEDAANEYTVRAMPIAFASRFPQAPPSGKRGVINTAESIASMTSQKYVFDWPTNTGNGTFQSVGWMNCDTLGRPIAVWNDPYKGTLLPVSVASVPATTRYRGGLWHDGTGWVTLHSTGTTDFTGVAVYRVNDVTGVGTILATLSGGFTYNPGGPWMNNSAACCATDLCMIGTDYYVVGFNGYSSSPDYSRVAKFNSAGTSQWAVQHDGGANEMPRATGWATCITTDGTDLYVGWGPFNTTTGTIYKISAATGLVTATIPLTGITGTVTGLAWNGTGFTAMVGGCLCNLDVAGNLISGTVGAYVGGSYGDSGTATAPFTGAFITPNSNLIQPSNQSWWSQGAPTGAMTAMTNRASSIGAGTSSTVDYPLNMGNSSAPGGGMHYRNGKVYALIGNTAGTVPTVITELACSTLGTRARLSSPVTKDSSKVMKITYQFDFS